MYKCKLTKVYSNHNNVRTQEILGVCYELPKLGECFTMIAPPLNSGDLRYIYTTPVITIGIKDEVPTEFTTKNSGYTLEVQELREFLHETAQF